MTLRSSSDQKSQEWQKTHWNNFFKHNQYIIGYHVISCWQAYVHIQRITFHFTGNCNRLRSFVDQINYQDFEICTQTHTTQIHKYRTCKRLFTVPNIKFFGFLFHRNRSIWTYTMAKRNSEAMVSYFRNSQNHPWWSSFFLKLLAQYRSSLSEVFLAKDVLKICRKFTGEHPCRSVISIKLLYNFIEITLRHGCSPINLMHIFRTLFPRNTSGWLLLPKFKYNY